MYDFIFFVEMQPFDMFYKYWNYVLKTLLPLHTKFLHKCRVYIVGDALAMYFATSVLGGKILHQEDGNIQISIDGISSDFLSFYYAEKLEHISAIECVQQDKSDGICFETRDTNTIHNETMLKFYIAHASTVQFPTNDKSLVQLVAGDTGYVLQDMVLLFMQRFKLCVASLMQAYKNYLLHIIASEILKVCQNPSDIIRYEKFAEYAKNNPNLPTTDAAYKEYSDFRMKNKAKHETLLRYFVSLCALPSAIYNFEFVQNSAPIGPLKELYEKGSTTKYLCKILPYDPIENMEEIFRCLYAGYFDNLLLPIACLPTALTQWNTLQILRVCICTTFPTWKNSTFWFMRQETTFNTNPQSP